MIRDASKIAHQRTQPNRPWNHDDHKTVRGTVFLSCGQVGRILRMLCRQTDSRQRNPTIKEATVKGCRYDSHEQPRRHLDLFIDADNHARRPKTLQGLTPRPLIWKDWQARSDLFYEESCHLTGGPHA